MGYLLKEALKTLCGINQWSYAVFWKIGSQNPKLLIWEDCYHEPTPSFPPIPGMESAGPPLENWEARWVSAENRVPRVKSKVPALVDAMMLSSQIKVVGQGLVGRTAFTGSHMWILSENFSTGTHPPEVKNEVQQQISAGIKTIAIIPVPSHGVVQLGSSSTIAENLAFVNDVQSLILQLGMIPGVLLSESYASREVSSKTGVPEFLKTFVEADPSENYKMKPSAADRSIQRSMPYEEMELVGYPSHSTIRQIGNSLEGPSSTFQTPKVCQNVIRSQNSSCLANLIPPTKPTLPFSNQFENIESRGEANPSFNPELLNQQASLYDYGFGFFDDHMNSSGDQLQSGAGNHLRPAFNLLSLPEQVDTICHPAGNGGFIAGSSQNSGTTSDLAFNHLLSGRSDFINHSKAEGWSQNGTSQRKERTENDLFDALNIPTARLEGCTNASENICVPSQSLSKSIKDNDHVQFPSGDDLFDILGLDFKNKILGDSWNGFLDGVPDVDMKIPTMNQFTSSDLQDADSDLYVANKGNPGSGMSCSPGSDHLLDAVVNKVNLAAKQSSDDSVSCTTALTKMSGFSLPTASPSYGGASVTNEMKREFPGLPKSLAKFVGFESGAYKSDYRKEDAGNYKQSSSIYGSQISSVSEQSQSMKNNSSASTAYSKGLDQGSKSNRKRGKPGENPRPRPKDRQMIQDRIKELRDIVPSGAKCSIDALLERTIKHMLFLQSVTKHADKLKQTGDPKIIEDDSGILLRDNFEGGRTWAYEVGSQSTLCPIIVEDLNQPRQMLVKMLCEEHGLFLEIADIVRGLGLTILKGVMETRDSKVWARFVVEANRDVSRMEIFLSLVHILDQNVKSNAASGSGTEKDILHHATSVPATSRLCSMQ